jgi:hypothetical protein
MDVCHFGFRLIHIIEHELAQSSEPPTFPSSLSLAPSVLSGKGSQPQSNTNNNNSLPRRLSSKVKRTYFSGALVLILRMRLLTGRSAVMCRGSSTARLVSSIRRRWICPTGAATAARTRTQARRTREGEVACDERRRRRQECARTDQRALVRMLSALRR